MDLRKLNKLIFRDKGRSPLALSILEVVVVAVVGVTTWFFFRNSIFSSPPWGYYSQKPFPPEFVKTQQQLFYGFVWPLIAFMSVSAVSVVRCIRNDVLHFSRLGHFTLIWPLASFPSFCIGFLSFPLLIVPFGIGLAVIGAIISRKEKANLGDLIALGVIVIWYVFGSMYSQQSMVVFGD
jgi:hypothetical protein